MGSFGVQHQGYRLRALQSRTLHASDDDSRPLVTLRGDERVCR